MVTLDVKDAPACLLGVGGEVRAHIIREGGGGVFILVVARQVIRPPTPPLLTHTYISLLAPHMHRSAYGKCVCFLSPQSKSEPMGGILSLPLVNIGMQNALGPKSSPAASRVSVFCSIYETLLLYFPPCL